MRILVTGGAGFIGQHVCRELQDHGHEQIVVDSFLPEVHGNSPAPHSHVVHVGDSTAMRRVLGSHEPDAVIHLAARVSVADSAVNPSAYMHGNSLATAILCEAIRDYQVKRLLVASSMSVYGEGPSIGLASEGWRIAPTSIYGLSKYDQERLCLLFGEQAGIPTMALRLFNVYGPGQSTTNPLTGVLANWAGAIVRGERPIVCEDGQQSRDFVFVRDVARAFRLAVESSQVGVVNIGTGVATTLRDAATMLATAFGRPDLPPIVTGEKRPGDIRHCVADAGRADEWLDWQANIDFADGLQLYAAHERERHEPRLSNQPATA